jgi:hypothetical protein
MRMDKFVPFDSFVNRLQTPEADENVEQQRKRQYVAAHYQGVEVVHSFVGDDGECIDCIKASTQSGLQGHELELAPPPVVTAPGLPSSTTAAGQTPAGAAPRLDRYGNVMQCPPGTIPKRRVTPKQLESLATLDEYFQKAPGGGAFPPGSGAARGPEGPA